MTTPPTADPAAGEGPHADMGSLAVTCGPALYRYAVSLTRDPATAEDLVQDTFLRALERGDTFRGDAPPLAWLRRVLHNLAVDRFRRTGREEPVDAADAVADDVERRWRADDYTVDAATVVERAQTREELEDALVRLPFVYRAAVVLHDVEAWTAADIADAQGIGLANAKQRIRRGRMMLVSELARGAERRVALTGVVLRCWDARRYVSDYLDGELDPTTSVALEQHLEGCPTCPPLYAGLVGVRAELGALRDPDSVVPPDLADRVADRAVDRRP